MYRVIKKENISGFTLIELLVSIIIIGSLGSIALPSFLNQVSKSKEIEAQQTLGSFLRIQQSHRFENGDFSYTTSNFEFASTSNYYDFIIQPKSNNNIIEIRAISKPGNNDLRNYSSALGIDNNGVFLSLVCESKLTSSEGGTATIDLSTLSCNNNSSKID